MLPAELNSADASSNGEAELNAHRVTLLDRMDPDIGDAAAGIGVLMTELVRRSLRGGVSNIDQHLQQFAHEQAQTAVEQQLPKVVNLATEIAETKSRQITDAAVTQITQETLAQTERVTSALQETEHRLKETVAETDQRLSQTLTGVEERLSTAITQTETQVQEKAQALTSAVDQLQTETRQTTRGLDERIGAIHEETAANLQTFESSLRESAKRSWERVNVQFEELRGQTALLAPLTDRLTQAETAHSELRGQLQQVQAAFTQQLQELQAKLDTTVQENVALTERIAMLEQPRGVYGWIKRKFTRKPKGLPE